MFCKYCGTKLADAAAFCHECGKATAEPVSPILPACQPPVQADPAQLAQLENQALIFGILGLSLSMLGVPGIVFSAISGSKASAYKKLTGALTGKALIGYRLAKPGKIVGIIMTVLLSILVPMLLNSEFTYYYTDPYSYF